MYPFLRSQNIFAKPLINKTESKKLFANVRPWISKFAVGPKKKTQPLSCTIWYLAPPPKTVGRVIYHTIPRRNWNILIPLWYFCRRPVFLIKLKNWLDPTRDLELQFWVLLVLTNKNHGQPLVQYAEISEPFLMGASVLSVLAASDIVH